MGPTPITRSVLFGIFSKITQKDTLTKKIVARDSGVYLYILFPITVAFLIAFTGARIISHTNPDLYLNIFRGLHIHHFAYGIIVLTASGYLALVSIKSRDKYLIALLYGMGLGLAFDEFGMWLLLSDNSSDRFSYDGVVVLIAFFVLMISAESGARAWRHHFIRKNGH